MNFPMFDIIGSELPQAEPEATFGGAGQLLIALPLAFLVLLFLLWLVIFVAGYIRRHAARIRTSLGETVAAKETPPSSPEEK